MLVIDRQTITILGSFGINKQQAALLGLKFPLCHRWKDELIGRKLSDDAIVSLVNASQFKKQKRVKLARKLGVRLPEI